MTIWYNFLNLIRSGGAMKKLNLLKKKELVTISEISNSQDIILATDKKLEIEGLRKALNGGDINLGLIIW